MLCLSPFLLLSLSPSLPLRYLAIDMQLYIVTPFLVMALHRSRRLGISLWAAVLLACTAITFYLSYYGKVIIHTNLMPTPSFESVPRVDYSYKKVSVDTSTHTMMADFFIGMILSFLLIVFLI